MAQFFQTAGNFFTTIYKYIKHLVQGILAIPQMFEYIGEFMEQSLAFIPAELVLFIFVIMMVCVVFHLIGR